MQEEDITYRVALPSREDATAPLLAAWRIVDGELRVRLTSLHRNDGSSRVVAVDPEMAEVYPGATARECRRLIAELHRLAKSAESEAAARDQLQTAVLSAEPVEPLAYSLSFFEGRVQWSKATPHAVRVLARSLECALDEAAGEATLLELREDAVDLLARLFEMPHMRRTLGEMSGGAQSGEMDVLFMIADRLRSLSEQLWTIRYSEVGRVGFGYVDIFGGGVRVRALRGDETLYATLLEPDDFRRALGGDDLGSLVDMVVSGAQLKAFLVRLTEMINRSYAALRADLDGNREALNAD